jgi:hypothetical protein
VSCPKDFRQSAAKEHRARGNRILALFKRYDRLVVGIDSIPGIFTLADYIAEVGAQALGLDDEDAELRRYAGVLGPSAGARNCAGPSGERVGLGPTGLWVGRSLRRAVS